MESGASQPDWNREVLSRAKLPRYTKLKTVPLDKNKVGIAEIEGILLGVKI